MALGISTACFYPAPTEEALRMVTLDAARLLGLADSTGSIEVGKRADLALFEGHPLRLSAIHRLTILGGKLIES